ELEDALDPLEKLAVGLNGSMKSLTELRLALGRLATTPNHAPDNEALRRDLSAYLAWDESKTALGSALEKVEKDLRAELEPRVGALDTKARGALGKAVAQLLSGGACPRREVQGSLLQSIRPPPKHTGACAAAAELCSGKEAGLAPLVALHEWTVLGI